ncbi:MAG: hypothetical protein KAY24_07710, partial [Candidatus Eisenbacteria sp.]|nr:hypothetical protein [Candidatus Eisenbacteria bacterium]
MKSKGSVLFLPKGDERFGSSRYRCYQVVPKLRAMRWDVSFGYICRTKVFRGKLRFIPDLIRTIALIVMKRIDLVYFQRSDHRRPRETGFVFRLCRWFG